MSSERLKAYRDAWLNLYEELKATGKTSWGKNELVEHMKDVLIQSMEAYLED